MIKKLNEKPLVVKLMKATKFTGGKIPKSVTVGKYVNVSLSGGKFYKPITQF
jgi:hypothetical protein